MTYAFLIIVSLFLLSYPEHIQAQSISNSLYEITSPSFTIGKNPLLKSEKKDENSSLSSTYLKFSLSDLEIEYGKLIAGEPLIRSVTLRVNGSQPYGYQILAQENTLLTDSRLHSQIPDTTCDSGICSELSEDVWSNPLTYGFGYQCMRQEGVVCLNNSQNKLLYNQFANKELGEEPVSIVQNEGKGKNSQAQLFIKLNVSGAQQPGVYKNTLLLLAVPSY